MPNPIRVDVTPPRIESFTARPTVISPDGDGRFDRAKIRYRVSERSVVELFVDGIRALRRSGTRTTGTMDWFGAAGGEPLPHGRYTLRLVARDVAGNLGRRSGSRTVAIRFLALGRDRVLTTPGGSFAILALSQSRTSLEARRPSGIARPGTLRLRAPTEPGRTCCESTRTATSSAPSSSSVSPPSERRRPDRGGRRRARPRGPAARDPARGSNARPRRLGSRARRARPLPPARPEPVAARRRRGRWARPLRRVRVGPSTLAVPPRLRHARLPSAPAPGRHRERRGQPPAAAVRRHRRAGPVARLGAPARGEPRA